VPAAVASLVDSKARIDQNAAAVVSLAASRARFDQVVVQLVSIEGVAPPARRSAQINVM
jgi:hypothetical protein